MLKNLTQLLSIATICALSTACGGSSSTDIATDTGDGDQSTTPISTASLTLPSSLEVVTNEAN